MCDCNNSFDWDIIIKFVTLIVGTLTLIKVVWEYTAAQRWKRAEFLSKQHSDFVSSEYVQTTMKMLEGYSLPIAVTIPENKSFVIDFTKDKIITALKMDQGIYDQRQDFVYIRLCFDKFVEGLKSLQYESK